MTSRPTKLEARLTKATRLPATVVALGLTSLFADVGSEMIFPLLPAFIASLGASPAFLGLIEGIADATSSLLKLASGYVADRVSRRKPIVVFGYGVAALARPLVALATAPWHVLAIRASDRVGKGLRASPRDLLIANSVETKQTGRAFGFHRAMDHAGAVVGPLVATGLLGAGLPLRTVFSLALVPGLLSVAAVLTVREPSAASTTSPHREQVARPSPLPASLRVYLGILALFSLGNSTDAFLLLRARDAGVKLAMLPLLWAVLHVSKLSSSYVGGAWADRVALPKLIVAGWLVYAATYLAFGVASQPWHIWTLFVVYGTYYGLTEPAEKALVKHLAPANIRGRAYGAYNFIVGIAAVPAGVSMGWLWQTWSPMAALTTGAGIACVASVAMMVWSRLVRTEVAE
jgi:MFS family permease